MTVAQTEENIVELEIIDVSYGGRGVGRLDNCVYFVPDVLKGETIKAKVTKRKKRFAEAELIEILTPAPERITPACPLSDICPGCAYQHVAYEKEVDIKQQQLINLLQRLGHADTTGVKAPAKAPFDNGYRNKITLHADTSGEKTILGYIGKDNKTVFDVPECHLAHPKICEKLTFLRSNVNFMKSLEQDMTVTLRYTEQNGVLFWKNRKSNEQRVFEKSILGTMRVPLAGFSQVYPEVSDMVIQDIMDKLQKIEPEFVIDVYCGAGIFALAASSCGVPAILGIDSNSLSIRAAQRNSAKLGLDRIEFIRASADRVISKALAAVNAQKTTVILDPPRRGLSNQVTTTLQKVKPINIIYVSCSPDTLSRDIAMFAEAGYILKEAQVFDMFPRTAKFETITWLTRAKK
jgi:tRNA/tmRNA/rRNA uracil-C5-methylase (TrmA/RlmC/RlmD family)